MKRLLMTLGLIACMAFLSYAQESTGEIIGKVTLKEDHAPLPGVAVTLTGETFGKSTFFTTPEGNFRFWKLGAGNYSLKFEMQGFKTQEQTGIRVGIRTSVVINVAMEPGGLEERISVTATAPLLNTRKASVGVNMTTDVVQSLPLSRRTSDIINLAPGVMTPDPIIAGQGSSQAHGFGVQAQRGEWSLDGASFVSTYGRGNMPTGVNTNRVEETQVTTSGQDITNVEGGPTVNFVSKRGGNRLSGSFFMSLLDNAFQSDKALPANMGKKPATGADPTITYLGYTSRAGYFRTYDYGAAFGGPIIRDNLWFFGSWGVIDDITKSYAGLTSDRYYRPDLYGKLNAQWGPINAEFSYNHHNDLALNVDFSSSIGGPNKLDRKNPVDTYTAQVNTTLWSKLLISAKFTFFDYLTDTGQANNVWTGKGNVTYDAGRTYNPPNRYYTFNYFKSPPYNTEATGYWQHYGDDQKRPYLDLEANYFAEKFLGGDHEFKIGADENYARFIEEYMAPNQIFVDILPAASYFKDPTNSPSKGALGYYWGRIRTYSDRYGEKRSQRTGAYFQDIMSYGRFTLNLGARVDWNSWAWEPATYHGLAPADVPLTAWNQWTGQITVKGGSIKLDPVFSPRISLTYDLFGTGKDLIKLGYSNYGGALNNMGFRAGFKTGNTRGEFTIPFIDLNGDYVPEMNEYNLGFPTPDQIVMMYAKGVAELAAWQAIHGAGSEPPFSYFTFPGWQWLAFAGNPLGNLATGSAPTDSVDSSFGANRVAELTLGYEKQLTEDISLQFMVAYKKEYNLPWARGYYNTPNNLIPVNTTIQIGTDPVTGRAVWATNPLFAKSPTGYVLFNYKNYYTDFKGGEIIFTKRLSHKWMLQASLDLEDWRQHYSKDEMPMSTLFDYYDGSVAAIQTYASTEPMANARWHFKINGLYQLPLGFTLSLMVDAREGYIVNNWVAAFSGQTLPTAGDKYGSHRLPTMWYTNASLEKNFQISDNSTMTLSAIAFNATDNLIRTAINGTKVPTQLNLATDVNKPMIIEFGIRYSFR